MAQFTDYMRSTAERQAGYDKALGAAPAPVPQPIPAPEPEVADAPAETKPVRNRRPPKE